MSQERAHFLRLYFAAHDFTMITHPALMKTEAPKKIFRFFHLGQSLWRYLDSIRES